MNLFWSTRMLADEKEHHLTEFLAAALHTSDKFRTAYADYLFADFANKHNWAPPEIESIKTQVNIPETTCPPAMLITLADGKTIACEHKLDAPETLASAEEHLTKMRQYLDLAVDGLIYIRISCKPPTPDVMTHTKYIHPHNRAHFLWQDLYPLLSCDDHVLLKWLQEGFEWLGFTPTDIIV